MCTTCLHLANYAQTSPGKCKPSNGMNNNLGCLHYPVAGRNKCAVSVYITDRNVFPMFNTVDIAIHPENAVSASYNE